MFTLDTNINEFLKGIESLEKDVLNLQRRLTGVGIAFSIWPKVRDRIITLLKENLLHINEVDVTSPRWQGVKKQMIGMPVSEYPGFLKSKGYGQYTTIRNVGGSWLPVIDDDHWKATGTMERHLMEELDQGIDSLNVSEANLNANIDVDVSQLDDAYPIIVDEKLMIATGGKFGLIRLTEEQESEIYKMLIQATGDISKELGGG
ncbi:MAG: hypothetical protein ACTSW7_01195 [Candidatus Thorarchaeota archaeon]|nr:hypothetical protein [Thermoplasmatales archaeon]